VRFRLAHAVTFPHAGGGLVGDPSSSQESLEARVNAQTRRHRLDAPADDEKSCSPINVILLAPIADRSSGWGYPPRPAGDKRARSRCVPHVVPVVPPPRREAGVEVVGNPLGRPHRDVGRAELVQPPYELIEIDMVGKVSRHDFPQATASPEEIDTEVDHRPIGGDEAGALDLGLRSEDAVERIGVVDPETPST